MASLSPLVDLSPDAPQIPYDYGNEKEWTQHNVHQGQRKLLMSEIQLLTEHYSYKDRPHPWVVYVGAAPGTHMLLLHEMFPNARFALWDGANFDHRLRDVVFDDGRHVFELNNEFFTDETCTQIIARRKDNEPMVFVSDIRLAMANFERGVANNMLDQQRWVEMLRPDLSMLKYRLPFKVKERIPMSTGDGSKVPYLDGELLYGIWPKKSSTETRLMVRKSDIDKPKRVYDFVTYESVMFHHNVRTRDSPFPVPPEFAGLIAEGGDIISAHATNVSNAANGARYCSCYDCLSELNIYKKYHEMAATNAGSHFADFSLEQLVSDAHAAIQNFAKGPQMMIDD